LVVLDMHRRVVVRIRRHSQIAMTIEVQSEVPSATTKNALKCLDRKLDR
jgi:hypothetical protein